MKFLVCLLSLLSLTTCFLNSYRILSQDNKGEYSATETYVVGNIVSVGDTRYYCSNAAGCSNLQPGTDASWKAYGANDALDLSTDTYSATATYANDPSIKIIYHQFEWTCQGNNCSDVNPVTDGTNPWVRGSVHIPDTNGGTDNGDTTEDEDDTQDE